MVKDSPDKEERELLQKAKRKPQTIDLAAEEVGRKPAAESAERADAPAEGAQATASASAGA